MPIQALVPASSPAALSIPMGLATPSALPPFGVVDVRKRIQAIQEVMKGVMKENTHYGTIPGTPKPSLWKAGAEVLCMTFRLAPMLESRVATDDPEVEWSYSGRRRDGTAVMGQCVGFFEVEATCTIYGPNGESLSRCSARCNNRESKYRSLPLFDVRNTIQKMAEKRAFVSAVLMATGASDIFTQDIEFFQELIEGRTIQSPPAPAMEISQIRSESKTPDPKLVSNTGGKVGHGLTPKREAWLRRVAEEAKIPAEVVESCLSELVQQNVGAVTAFFDELARLKGGAFKRFAAS